MLALILAGGKGSRLGMGEKALVRLCGKPLIEYSLDACKYSGLEHTIVTTPYTPYTENYCRARSYNYIRTEGSGYIEDLIEAVLDLDATDPILTICVDIPGLTPDHISCIREAYISSGLDACSVWVPEKWYTKFGFQIPYHEMIENQQVCPAGINILRGDKISDIQTEYQIILDDPALAVNINTKQDLTLAEQLLPCDKVHRKINTEELPQSSLPFPSSSNTE